VSLDDYDELKAIVKMGFAQSLGYECPGFKTIQISINGLTEMPR
jgi:hypothetical protein